VELQVITNVGTEAVLGDSTVEAFGARLRGELLRPGGAYLNFPGFLEEGQRLMRDAYGENYERLVTLKDKHDPTNLFRLNQNIEPTA
jgi:FAD/FMN-containing dehydrogenase